MKIDFFIGIHNLFTKRLSTSLARVSDAKDLDLYARHVNNSTRQSITHSNGFCVHAAEGIEQKSNFLLFPSTKIFLFLLSCLLSGRRMPWARIQPSSRTSQSHELMRSFSSCDPVEQL